MLHVPDDREILKVGTYGSDTFFYFGGKSPRSGTQADAARVSDVSVASL